MNAHLFSTIFAETASKGGIPWWVWVILIIILLVILWYWFGREEEEALESGTPVEEPVVPDAQKMESVQIEDTDMGGTTPVVPDDLKKIEGVGPKVASLLNQAGIMTFQQVVDAGAEKIEAILDEASLQMINADTWPEQAKLAAAGDWKALETLQDVLKGGKRA